MKQDYGSISPRIADFMKSQKIFFVATSPLSENGHVNVSPKGYDTFQIIDEKTVAYLDLSGSGVETIAHIRENNRITVLFCAFEGSPKIIRLYGKGTVITKNSPFFDEHIDRFPKYSGARAVILIDVIKVSGSCGFSIPIYKFISERDQLIKWSEKRGEDWIKDYQKTNNTVSIDSIPALSDEDI